MHTKLSATWDLPPIIRRLKSGIKPESLKPNGTFATDDGAILWSQHFLGFGAKQHFLEYLPEDGRITAWEIAIRIRLGEVDADQLKIVHLIEHLQVGRFGYLLYPDEGEQAELNISGLPNIEPAGFNHSIQIQVDPKNRRRWKDHKILPRKLSFVPHDYSQILSL